MAKQYKTGKIKIDDGISSLTEEFRQKLIADGKREATIKSYVDNDAIVFVDYLKTEKNRQFEGRFTREEIEEYLKFLISEKYMVATINKKVNSLFVFNRFLIEKGIMSEYAITLKDRLQKPKKISEGVKMEEMELGK